MIFSKKSFKFQEIYSIFFRQFNHKNIIMEMKKNPKADLENFRKIFLLLGLIVALIGVYFILGYSVKNVRAENLTGENQVFLDEEQILITKRNIETPPPPPPKIRPSNIIEIVSNDTKIKNIFNINVETGEDEEIFFDDPDLGNDNQDIDTTIYELKDLSRKPEPVGGMEALYRFIAENIDYPEEAIQNEIEGTVYVRFVVTYKGKVDKVQIFRGVDPLLDEEAVRVVKKLPPFKPGMQAGHPVNVWFILPITFKLSH